ncbi:hypothetical protein PoB_003494400 [Plakobranchus ocellatus]|uniref:Uncharacterized protein n=1 Tax=Plakobranchus ocellatus TaxID=259542 RepID=A0AAV4AQ44_9GAST|nr:hypothetical protein PoB_003494400 [Plakobranchus ocellatus]
MSATNTTSATSAINILSATSASIATNTTITINNTSATITTRAIRATNCPTRNDLQNIQTKENMDWTLYGLAFFRYFFSLLKPVVHWTQREQSMILNNNFGTDGNYTKPWHFSAYSLTLLKPFKILSAGCSISVDSELVLRAVGTILSRVRFLPPAPWPDGDPEILRNSSKLSLCGRHCLANGMSPSSSSSVSQPSPQQEDLTLLMATIKEHSRYCRQLFIRNLQIACAPEQLTALPVSKKRFMQAGELEPVILSLW